MDLRGRWLCPTELDRARVVEASERLRRARAAGSTAIALTLLASAPFVGWWVLGIVVLSAANTATMERRLRRSDRPERIAMASVIWSLLLIAAGVALTGGPQSPFLPWLMIPGASAAARFRGPVTLAVAGLTAAITLAVTVPVDPAAFLADPLPVIVALALLVNASAITGALVRAELGYRDRAVLDPLTGLLNRAALESRVTEIEQQAALTGGSVSLVACDIDRFKRVNDVFGHEQGDEVLKAVAYELRKALRKFDPVYRIGGEEFVVLLPGAALAAGMDVGERLRRSIERARPEGLELSLSVGVACASGEDVRYESLFRAADAAMIHAKRAGRNRVQLAGAVPKLPHLGERRLPPPPSAAEPVGSAR
jgi:diguanylate cyclase (GGDEF)-like protein